MADRFLDLAQAKVRRDEFELSQHAQREAAAEQVSVDDMMHAILHGQELEPSPGDPKRAELPDGWPRPVWQVDPRALWELR